MKRLFVLSICFFLGSTILFAQSKDEKAIIIKDIQEKDKQLELFFQDGLVDSIVKLFSPNCHYIPEYRKIIEGRDEVAKSFSSEFKTGLKIIDMKLNPIEHKVYGDIVLELGTCNIKYTTKSNPSPESKKFNYLINWKASKKGNYRIRAAMWNSVKTPCN